MKVLEKLAESGKIGNMTTRNRIVMPPMVTNFADHQGFITQKQIEYYTKRAEGGVGYITFEHTSISRQGRLNNHVAMIETDAHKDSLRRLVDAVHQVNCPIVVQINHAGRQTSCTVTGEPIVAPSPIPCPIRKEMPLELRIDQIRSLVRQFADAAGRVQAAEADGVEIQMGHGGLICSFLSPISNNRQDDYGRAREGRAKFAREILQAVRKRVGNDFPVICRMSWKEFVDGGIELDDTTFYARLLKMDGADAIHVSAASAASIQMNHPPYYLKEGVNVQFAEEIKQTVGLPVIVVGRIRDPRHAETILLEERADFVSMGRALIADPFLPKKAFSGVCEDIVPCISCNRCVKSIRQATLSCTVNPEVGSEKDRRVKQAKMKKTVMIAGGGPAGMKAAQAAALNGHRVLLYEKKAHLGGQARLAAMPPEKGVFLDFVHYLERQIQKLPVVLHLNTLVTPEMVEEIDPDALIVATGSRQQMPEIPGNEKVTCFLVEAVFSGKADLGGHTVVVGGGGIGAEITDYISEKGITVTLIELREDIAMDLTAHLSYFLKKRLSGKDVRILTSTRLICFDDRTIIVEGPQGQRNITGFDSVVLALKPVSEQRLKESLEGKVKEIHIIGDALAPREIMEAVAEGEAVGRKL